MRRAARIDENQPDVVSALRGIGATVQPLHTIGKGCPDLLVGYGGRTLLMEVKDGDKAPSDRALTGDQILWHAAWRGGDLVVVNNVDEAVDALRLCAPYTRVT